MTPTVEQLYETMASHRLLSSADLSRLRTRWFQKGRAEIDDVDKFGQWLVVNGYMTAFTFRMLRAGKADLLRLNQYQLVDHLARGPFAGAYLATDPAHRRVALDVLATDRAADPEAVRAFQAAAEQAMSVRHPNVSLTLDFGESQGWHYLVHEYDEGESLADILVRHGKLQPILAARFFALAFGGLQALHDKQVPAGPLDPQSLILAPSGKSPRDKSRTVKILHSGVPRSLFDPSALDKMDLPAARRDDPVPAASGDDLFRLGVLFYRCLTGQAPFETDSPAEAMGRAAPVSQRAPDLPPILAHLADSLIDSDPAQRPASASRAAKSLRVFLASEEETQHGHPEDHLAPHAAPEPAEEESIAEKEGSSAEGTSSRTGDGTLTTQLKALWEEFRPGQRDLVFLGLGAAWVILMVLFLALLTGIHFVNLVCLLTGGALSFFVERLLHLRDESAERVDGLASSEQKAS